MDNKYFFNVDFKEQKAHNVRPQFINHFIEVGHCHSELPEALQSYDDHSSPGTFLILNGSLVLKSEEKILSKTAKFLMSAKLNHHPPPSPPPTPHHPNVKSTLTMAQ